MKNYEVFKEVLIEILKEEEIDINNIDENTLIECIKEVKKRKQA